MCHAPFVMVLHSVAFCRSSFSCCRKVKYSSVQVFGVWPAWVIMPETLDIDLTALCQQRVRRLKASPAVKNQHLDQCLSAARGGQGQVLDTDFLQEFVKQKISDKHRPPNYSFVSIFLRSFNLGLSPTPGVRVKPGAVKKAINHMGMAYGPPAIIDHEFVIGAPVGGDSLADTRRNLLLLGSPEYAHAIVECVDRDLGSAEKAAA